MTNPTTSTGNPGPGTGNMRTVAEWGNLTYNRQDRVLTLAGKNVPIRDFLDRIGLNENDLRQIFGDARADDRGNR